MTSSIRTLMMAALLLPAAAIAHEGGEDGACRADAEKLCKDVQPGGGRIMKCLKEHEADLSPECKERGAAMKKRWEAKKGEWEDACKADQEKLCADVKPGGGRIIRCLKDHEKDLTTSCRDLMASKGTEWKKNRSEAEEACGKDKERLCGGVEPGEGRIMRCMKDHEKDLSQGCRDLWQRKKSEWKQKSDKDSDSDKKD